MNTTANGLAVREDNALSAQQHAALGQLGLKDAPEGDLAVFLHVSQRTRLDPFARQIYMIGRNEKTRQQDRNGKWVDVWGTKYTIQTGIEGFRVIRARAEREEGVRGILSRPVYYDGDLKEYKVWVSPRPPAAVEMTYTVRDRNGTETPYTSVLRYSEYVQTRDDNGSRVPVAQWAVKPVHMLEKCTEADVYRKAFPQDYSGVELDDAMAPAGDAAGAVAERHAPPVGDLRQRAAAQTVKAEVVTSPSPAAAGTPPADAHPRTADAHPEQAAGEALIRKETWNAITERLAGLGIEEANRARVASRIAGKAMKHATEADGRKVRDTLDGLPDGVALDGLLAELALADDPRGDGETDGE